MLDVGLKEWASVCAALETGRQIILLRKGGIHESAGEFELEHSRFVLFPTYLHQNLKMLKPAAHVGFEPHSAEPAKVKLAAGGVVSDILQVKSRAQIDALDGEHVWTAPLIDMRFNYRPENPLYLMIVRVHRLTEPRMIENTPEYAGCKSWVPLREKFEIGGPVLADEMFEMRRAGIREKMK